MATYRITINEKTKTGKNLIALLESLKDVVLISAIKKSSALEEAIEDVERGRTSKAKNAKDLIEQCLS